MVEGAGIRHRQQKNKLSGVRGKQILAHPLAAHCLKNGPKKELLVTGAMLPLVTSLNATVLMKQEVYNVANRAGK